ncbi:MAG TPA: ABC transporter C-terminal domain-containing protein, partial [Smithella sp.]|nr:ABC transporter C-terminal domain-containing protein [Smithella sp.]
IRAALKKELSDVEKKISGLEDRKTRQETALCDPQTKKDARTIKSINLELKDINRDLEQSYTIWTDLHMKLEQISANAEPFSS